MPRQQGIKLPGTLQRSPVKAQRIYIETLRNAEKQYGSGERAGRTAFAALKHEFEKVGDHWVPKKQRGASDTRSLQRSTAAKRQGKGETFGGIDVLGNTFQELYTRARDLDVRGRSSMNKLQLARAIAKKQK